jgi:hypothetical protein
LSQRIGAAIRAAPRRPAEDSSKGHETVLVLEREQILREILAGILRQSGYRVLEAAGGPTLNAWPMKNESIY